ncbi:MAG: 30S ribosomal protein S15 [Nanoarchaeota archaeon]|nr:30S ribosomal protein S15 [Nanoarchaeota archaeon]
MATKTELKKPVWLKTTEKQLEKLVLDIAKTEKSPEKIGLTLRDNHGIPTTKLYGKKISQILKENKVEFEKDLDKVEKKVVKIQKHLETNHKDQTARRSLIIRVARRTKLKNYYKKKE